MSTIEEILAQAEDASHVRVVVARVLLRGDLVSRHADLEAELAEAVAYDQKHNESPTAPAVAQRIADLEAETEAAKVEFRFKPIGHRAWADLLAEHPPTKDQKRVDPRIDFNPLTFPAAAIAKSCSDPVMSHDQALTLEKRLDESTWMAIWNGCVEANLGGGVPKSAAAGAILRASELFASTHAPAASPDPSSSGE
jgi:hypothetical protein